MSRDERRRLPRISVALPVSVTTAEDASCEASSVNISLSGLQIACDPWAASVIAGDRQVLQMARGLLLQLQIGGSSAIAASTLWVRRASQDDYHFGLQYVGLTEENGAKIARILEAHQGM